MKKTYLKWEGELLEKFKIDYQIMSSYELLKEYKKPISYLKKIASKHRIKRLSILEKIDEGLLKNLSLKYTQKKTSEILNVTPETLRTFLNKNNKKLKFYSNKKYKINHDYFDTIDTPNKAYFLGLLVADGYIRKNVISISLQQQDNYILEFFKKELEYDGKVKYLKPRYRKKILSKPQYLLTFTSKKVAENLKNLGVIQNKTHFTYFPDISKNLWSHFIRGVFDGDGCISKWKNGYFNFSIVGNIDLIEKIQEILIKECELNKTKLQNTSKKSNNIVSMTYGGNKQLQKIKNYLYKNANCYLQRKKEKFDSCKQSYS